MISICGRRGENDEKQLVSMWSVQRSFDFASGFAEYDTKRGRTQER